MRKNYCVDEEFKSLIPPLSEAERSQLEESCIKYGIKDSIKVWGDIIVDGHNRYEIAKKHGLKFRVTDMKFNNSNEARLWIVENQFSRRNLSVYDRCALALKFKPLFIKKAKANQERTAENRVCQKSDKQRMNTNKELAKIAGVSHDTIHKVAVIEEDGDQELIAQIRNGDISINEAYRRVKGIPPKKPVQPMVEEVTTEVTTADEVAIEVPVEEVTTAEDAVVADVSIEVPVVEEPLPFGEKIEFIETEESHEEVPDPNKDSTETTDLDYAEKVLGDLLRIIYYVDDDVIDRICNLDDESFDRKYFKSRVSACIQTLVRLENRLL